MRSVDVIPPGDVPVLTRAELTKRLDAELVCVLAAPSDTWDPPGHDIVYRIHVVWERPSQKGPEYGFGCHYGCVRRPSENKGAYVHLFGGHYDLTEAEATSRQAVWKQQQALARLTPLGEV